MNTIGNLDESRMALIPPKHWRTHEFCFYLHDSLLRALVEYEASGAHNIVTEAFHNLLSEHQQLLEIDILQFLKANNIIKPYKHHLISHLVFALTGDMLNFLYEALSCFEKRKFSVAFSILRKPLKENLLFLCWLLANEDEFIKNFESNNYLTLNNLRKEKQLEILAAAICKLPFKEAFDAELLWNHIYSKNHAAGFEPTWQRATHLITSQGDLLKTEDYSINFIFENPFSNVHYDLLYSRLPYVLFFASQVIFECFNRILKMNAHTYNHMAICSMGCYEALFLKSKAPLAKMLNKELKPFLQCIHCQSIIKITKGNAPAMYVRDSLICNSCGFESSFPFYWLIAKANITINGNDNSASKSYTILGE